MPKITPNLWFDTESEEAAKFYCSIFPKSKINAISHYTEVGPREEGMVLTVDFTLDGQSFTAINGGPEFTFDEAVSFLITCKDQKEIDYYWDKLLEGGGSEGQCGWLKDKYGVSWQVAPAAMDKLLQDPDKAKTNRAMEAMLGMKKIDIAEIENAAAGKG